MEEIIEKLKEWYSSYACSYTSEKSMGNYDDCFSDGVTYGTSFAAYEVGQILGMDLEELVEEDYEY